eukprot:5446350-Pyramimonas_sp.AAC.1
MRCGSVDPDRATQTTATPHSDNRAIIATPRRRIKPPCERALPKRWTTAATATQTATTPTTPATTTHPATPHPHHSKPAHKKAPVTHTRPTSRRWTTTRFGPTSSA